MTFYNLNVLKCQKETSEAVVITFEISDDVKEEFKFIPGQYLTIKAEIDGAEVRRAYSICSASHESHISILAKRVEGGKMSNYLNDKVNEGDTLSVLAPEGRFTLTQDFELSRAYYFFAAGSGITPIMSMISSTLESEPMSSCYLLYGNRNEASILLNQQLIELQNRYEGQILVSKVLSQPKKKKGGLFSRSKTSWDGGIGRIDSSKIVGFLEEHENNKEKLYFICGPGDMIENTATSLLGYGIESKLIKKEFFTNAGSPSSNKSDVATDGVSRVTVTLEGKETILAIDDKLTILDAMVKAGVEPPFSCSSGACATCIAKVHEGTVEMDSCFALDDDEIADGMILTCQAHPTSPEVVLTYDI